MYSKVIVPFDSTQQSGLSMTSFTPSILTMFGGTAYLWACAVIALSSSGRIIDAQHTILVGPESFAATGCTGAVLEYSRGRGITAFDIPSEYETGIYTPHMSPFLVDWLNIDTFCLGKLVGGGSSINAALYFRPPNKYVTKTQWLFSVDSMNAKMDENELSHGTTDRPSTDST